MAASAKILQCDALPVPCPCLADFGPQNFARLPDLIVTIRGVQGM